MIFKVLTTPSVVLLLSQKYTMVVRLDLCSKKRIEFAYPINASIEIDLYAMPYVDDETVIDANHFPHK